MRTITQAKSGDKHHLQLAMFWYKGGSEAQWAFDYLKENKYVLEINGELIHFQATSIRDLMTGMYAVNTQQPICEYSLDNPELVSFIEQQFLAGSFKITKKNGLVLQ